VANAVVVAVPHAVKGWVPAAMVVLNRGAAADADAIRQYCLDNGPKYAHPRLVKIVPEAELPLNGAGKIDRREVKAVLAGSASGMSLQG
jgi:acyl-coenzyme A synthetase/AMP-(fatty) acid ligase